MTLQSSFRLCWASALAIAAALLILPVTGSAEFGPILKAGVCVRDITPISPGLESTYADTFGQTGVVNHTDPVYMAGFGDNRAATGYHDRLWARGVVLGKHGKVLGAANRARAEAFAQGLAPVVQKLRAEGARSVRAMTAELNRRGVPTATGAGQWHLPTVHRLLHRLGRAV